jgi:hypothetical protein
MRKIHLLLLSIFSLFFVSAQMSSITAMNIYPSNPTDQDSITVYIDLSFANSSCPLDNKGIQVIGTAISSFSHHCQGMLTATCNTTDTFNLAPLASGTYNIIHISTSGSGMVPCTPGIVIDDIDTLQFEVISTGNNGIMESSSSITVYPNPSNDDVFIDISGYNGLFVVEIYDLQGRCLAKENKKLISLQPYTKGVYLLRVNYVDKVEEIRVVKD